MPSCPLHPDSPTVTCLCWPRGPDRCADCLGEELAVNIRDTKEFEFRTDLQRVGCLRQWLNEDRIDDPKKMVTTKQLLMWLRG